MKKYKKEIRITFIIFVIFFGIWVFGASSLFIEMPFLPDFWLRVFRDISNLENVFSPVAAFFGGLSAFGTTILIYLQIKLNKKQEQDVRRNIFENQIGQMFLMKNEIVKSLSIETFSGEKYKNRQIFEFLYESIYYLLSRYLDSNKLRKQEISLEKLENVQRLKDIVHDIDEYFGQLYSDDERGIVTIKKASIYSILRTIEKHLDEKFKYILSLFYHNVYTTLKMIYSNEDISDIERLNYMRMFRSQFTQHEFALIYFHALVYNDNKKFKKLIENTCFFHSLIDGFIFIDITEKEYPGFGYQEKAFKHD